MRGICLRSLTEALHPVEPGWEKNPAGAISGIEQKLGSWTPYAECRPKSQLEFSDLCIRLPLEALGGFTFDELCKIKHSSGIMMHSSVEKLFEESEQHEVFRKIVSSMWRWSFSKGSWNEVAEFHSRLRSFSLRELPGFELRLDYTTWFNPCGWSKFECIYLDGVFGLLLYSGGEHVLTISFSIASGRRVLIQQVQSPRRRGNRKLFSLPSNRLEFAIRLMEENFPGYSLWVIDGAALVGKTSAQYREAIQSHEKTIAKYQSDSCGSESWAAFVQGDLTRRLDSVRLLTERIEHLEQRAERVKKFYADGGTYKIGSLTSKFNSLPHHLVQL